VASAQSTARIEELLQEDQNAKRRRERYQKQSSLLSNLMDAKFPSEI
jgi:dynamin GTPase